VNTKNIIKDLETDFQAKTKISKAKDSKTSQINNTFEKLLLYYSKDPDTRLSPSSLQDPVKLMNLALSSFRNSLPVWGSSVFRNQFALPFVEALVDNLTFDDDDSPKNSERAIYSPDNIFWINLFNQIAFKLHLIDLYFTYSHPFWPLFSKSKFYDNLDICPSHLMYSICFAGYQHHAHYDIKLWQYLFTSSLVHINRVKYDIRLSVVKSCLLTCRSIIHYGKLTEGWLLLSQAIKMAEALGLHTVKPISNCFNISDYEKSLTWNMCLRLQYSFNNGKRRPPIVEFPYYHIPREVVSDESCLEYCSISSEKLFSNLNYRFQLYSTPQITPLEHLDAQLIMLNYKIERSYILPIRDRFLLLKQRHTNKELNIDELESQQMEQYFQITRIHLITQKLYKHIEENNESIDSLARINLFHDNYLIIYYSFINSLFSLHIPSKFKYDIEPLSQLLLTTSQLLSIIQRLPPTMVDYRYYSLFISMLNCVKNISKFNNFGKSEVDYLLKGVKLCFEGVGKKFDTLDLSWKILDKIVKNSIKL
jgi:hypothetical protein